MLKIKKSISLFVLLHLLAYVNGYAQNPDMRGPIESDQFKVNQADDGIYATDFSYKPFLNSTINSKWIWINAEKWPDQQATKAHWTGNNKAGKPYVVKFKKIVYADADIDIAHIKMSADIQYRLFINGKLIECGPANIGSDYNDTKIPLHWFYDEFDSKKAFKKGLNIIAVEVSTMSKTASSVTIGHGGLIMDARIKLKTGKIITVKTDTSWVCDISKAYLPDFSVDASKESFAWITAKDYGMGWSHAVFLNDSLASKWKLRQSELPQMMQKKILPVKLLSIGASGDSALQFPIVIKASPPPKRIRVQFKNLYAGYLGFRVSGKSGIKLNFITKEVDNKAQEYNYTLSDGVQTFEFPNLIDCKFIDVTVMNPNDDITINEISVNYSSFPVTYKGYFDCSDSLLNAIWKNIRWVTQINMQTYHMDSPLHQEPVCDAGDYLIESMVNYYAFSSPLLIKQDLRKIALILNKTDYTMFHTSYMLLWEQMLLNYYEYTGDRKLLEELSPYVYKLLDKFHGYLGPTGIITEAPNYMFMDWGTIAKIPFHHPPASLGQGYLTAFYYKSLVDGAEIARCLHDDNRSSNLMAQSKKIKTAFYNNLFDSQHRLFKNGLSGVTKVKPSNWLPKDTTISTNLPYVNTLAVAYGLAPPGTEKNMIDYIINQKDVTVSPYFMYFVFEALAKSNMFNEYGLEQLRRWKKISQCPVGLKEGWNMGDYSHAWAGSAAYELSSKVLGISPAKPGFKEILIKPNPGDLKWAKGAVATPYGNVFVSWKKSRNGLSIKTQTPVNTSSTVILRLFQNTDIIVNGKKVMSNNQIRIINHIETHKNNSNEIMIQISGGTNTIEIFQHPA